MKSVSLVLAAIVIAFSLPACASSKKSQQCCGASCETDSKTVKPAHLFDEIVTGA